MHLKSLNILNFKTYEQVDLVLHPKINCFVGNNGVGKTNLLDSIYYLSMCKSNFNAIDYQNIRHQQNFFLVQGTYSRQDKDEVISCAVSLDNGKTVKRNGKEYQRLADHIGLLPVVIISPADSALITEGSEERRKYMNSVISQYNRPYLDHTIKYNKLLANRNKLLKETSYSNASLIDLLDVIDDQLDQLAKAIYEQRLDFARRLTPIFQQFYNQITSGAEEVELAYQSHIAEKSLKELLVESIDRDKSLQYTTKGVHKDDILLNLNGRPIRKEGSQGQQKSLLIALKLAQFNFIQQISGIKPILLLDDIFDKLDMNRVEHFIRLVADNSFGQIFITDTSRDRLHDILSRVNIDYSLYNVEKGSVSLIDTI